MITRTKYPSELPQEKEMSGDDLLKLEAEVHLIKARAEAERIENGEQSIRIITT